jgi:glutamate racemase
VAGMAAGTIGVFDSGVGGLSVLREIRALLPCEELHYVADSGHVPYGNKSAAYIEERSLRIAGWLRERDAKCIVVACNTATAAAATTLREVLDIPVVAMEPAIKPAVAATRSGVVGVLATVGTARSERLTSLIERFGRGVQVLTQPCPGIVERIEGGDLDSPALREILEQYVDPLLERGADTLVLGCTHYPFLRPLLEEIAGRDVALIDTGAAVARRTAQVLAEQHALGIGGAGTARFWSSGNLVVARRVISLLWGNPSTVEPLLV